MKPVKTMTDPSGQLVPIKYVSDYDRERDRIARRIHKRFKDTENVLRKVKADTLQDIFRLRAMAEKDANVSLGGEKGNIQFRSFDGNITVNLDIQYRTEFDERLAIAQQLIREAVKELSADASNADLVEIATQAFAPRKSGNLDMQRIRDLRKYKVSHPKWKKACEIISECERSIGSTQYVRVFERTQPDARPTPITLDIAVIPVDVSPMTTNTTKEQK